MNAFVFLGSWLGLSLVAGIGVGQWLGRAGMAMVPAQREVTGYRAVR